MLLKNQSWLRGFLYFLAVVGVTYYLYLNAVYYFLGKTSRFDFLSPWLSKLTGTTRETPKKRSVSGSKSWPPCKSKQWGRPTGYSLVKT